MADDPVQMREKLLESYNSRPIIEAIQKQGITNDYLAEKLKEELNATLPKLFQSDGKVVESREVPVWDVRQRARQDAHKLKGDYAPEKISLEGSVQTRQLDDETREWLERTKQEIINRAKKID